MGRIDISTRPDNRAVRADIVAQDLLSDTKELACGPWPAQESPGLEPWGAVDSSVYVPCSATVGWRRPRIVGWASALWGSS